MAPCSPSIGAALKRAIALVTIILPLTGVHVARGQGADGTVPGDTSAVLPRFQLRPLFEASTGANVTSHEMKSTFSNMLIGSDGLTLMSSLSASQTNYRVQDRREESKLLSNTLSKMVLPGVNLVLSQSNSRVLNRAALVTGGFQDFILNNQALTGNVSYTSVGPGPVGWDAHMTGTITDSEYAFKHDKGQGGQLNGGVRYRFWDDGRVKVSVRGAYRELNEKSTSVLQTYDGLSTTEDSLMTAVAVALTDSLNIGLDWMDYNSERVFADQLRGSTGAQNVGAENLFRETERKEMRRVGFRVDTSPLEGLNLKMSAGHSESVNDYVNTPTRYSRTVEDRLDGDLRYQMDSGTAVSVKLENSESLRDLGPQSVSSYNDVRKRVSLSLSKTFTKTFRGEFSASQAILQSFYLNFDENPRDRDQLDSSVRARFSSSPFPKITTDLSLAVTSSDFINTHFSQSENNRTKDRYDFRPTITYKMSRNVTVEQGYGLAIEVTDFHFKPDENFLDRNVTFSNRVNHTVTSRLKTSYYYALTLHDRGSYLPLIIDGERVGNEEYLDVEREDRTDESRITFEYKMSSHVSLVGRHDYSRRRDETVATGRTHITENGGIEGGVVGSYNWGAGRDLTFEFKRAERFSPFGTEDQKKYWIANMSFKYAF